jgi:hypothetical protein
MYTQKEISGKISEIAQVRTGVYAKPSLSGVARYLQARDFNEFGELDRRVKPQLMPRVELEKHILIEGDILFAAKGTNNFATVFRSDIGPAVASSSFFLIRILEQVRSQVLPDYLAWFINSPRSQSLLKGKAKGSNPPSITIRDLRDLVVPLPPMHVQELVLVINDLRVKERKLTTEIEDLKELYIQYHLTKAIETQRG